LWSGPRLAFHRRPGAAFFGVGQRSRDIVHVLRPFLTGCASENVSWECGTHRDHSQGLEPQSANCARGSGRRRRLWPSEPASRSRRSPILRQATPTQPGRRHATSLSPWASRSPSWRSSLRSTNRPAEDRRNVTEMRLSPAGTPRNRPAAAGTPIRPQADDLALEQAMPGTTRNSKECARRESNPRPSA
jgi:hypothetical protein